MINDELIIRKRKWPRITIIIVIILLLLFFYYPIDLESTMGLKDITSDDILGISLHIRMPSREGEEIRLENITDKDFIEDVLSILSNHTMRERRLQRGDTFPIRDFTKPLFTDIEIILKDAKAWISISYDSRYVQVLTTDGYKRYKLYGDGIDTKGILESVKEKVENEI